MGSSSIAAISMLFAIALAAPRSSVIPNPVPQENATVPAANASKLIYVSDFELDAENYQQENKGLVPSPLGLRPHILSRPNLTGSSDPQERVQHLVDLMSESLVTDLKKAGYDAERLLPGAATPKQGLLLHGVFTEVSEGDRLRMAVIGFGAGGAKMDLFVAVNDLAHPGPALYSEDTSDKSKKTPGAVITLNPYVAAAKFVMDKNASDKVVKKTASNIVKDMTKTLGANTKPKTQ